MNVGALLTKAAMAHPYRVAVQDGHSILTYVELDTQARAFGSGLRAKGLRPGDRVAILMRNRSEYLVALFGIFKAGLVAVPINARLHAREVGFIVADCRCKAIVTDQEFEPTVVNGQDLSRALLVIRTESGIIGVDFQSVLEVGGWGAPDADVEPTTLAWIFYTSGTTGHPKGAMLSHRNLMAMTMSCLADVVSFEPEDVVLHCAPLSHGSGLYSLASIARASKNIIYAGHGFDANDVLGTIAEEDVSVIAFLAPTMIVMLLGGDPAISTPKLRTVVYGGAPIHLHHARAAINRFGRVFVQIYGQGEAPMTISCLRARDHDPDDTDALSSAGSVRTDVEVSIRDPAGALADVGEVCVRGDVVMLGYWEDETATDASLRDGWLRTGDSGLVDEHGRLRLLDRMSDMIISGGSNIYPREVEDVLLQHPRVHEAAVFGVPDDLWGESVAAAVVPVGPPPSAEELIDHCREHLASFKKPKYVAFVDVLPKNAYGKVLKQQLPELLPNSTGFEVGRKRD